MPFPYSSTYPSASTWPGFVFGTTPTTGEVTEVSLQNVQTAEVRVARGWVAGEAVLVKATTREWPT